jgi:hypothetical protein
MSEIKTWMEDINVSLDKIVILLNKIQKITSYIITYSDSQLIDVQCTLIENEIKKFLDEYEKGVSL